MRAPDTNGYYCVTRKGAAIKNAADQEAYRHGNLLPVALLNPKLAEKVRPMFLRGDYSIAVLQSFIEVEIAVRKAGKLSNELVGVKLMRTAFHPDNGALTDQNAVYGEREALTNLYAGAIGHCKNPVSHRDVSVTRTTAARLITLASHLLDEVETILALQSIGAM